ncbi:FAM3B protein, partial [Erythrocercus mccallii]|nr:FAM3B protein [Erythrocercus mccallii]
LRLFVFLLASLVAWYLGYFVAAHVPQNTISIAALQEVGKKPVLRERDILLYCNKLPVFLGGLDILFCGGFLPASMEGKGKYCKLDSRSLIRGKQELRVAVLPQGVAMVQIPFPDLFRVQKDKFKFYLILSCHLLIVKATGSSRLKNDAKKLVEELGSKEIKNIKFRSSWVFIAAKGFKLPDNIQREKV